ncbi:hypothetical protein IMSHALPRED_003716 [Imshaugia aleurites]|uniref:FAD synthase n=1 Tax=Imshaugia aleurites TaxID=172621 RepID=A0A8H3F4V3_9LECA|nr:hypothetical protein IMSHALPRED_003716 [Imshaugia aleurites]
MTETGTSPSAHAPVPESPLSNGDCNPLRTLCADLHARITAFLQEDVPTERLRDVQAQCRRSLAIISEALERYPLETLSLSYNGGKDCLVLLILYLSLLPTHPSLPPALPSILIPPPHPFPSVDAFIATSCARYHLSLSQYTSPSMKSAFADYLSGTGRSIRAIMVGTRRTDPHGADLAAFEPTDHGWPAFMRVHPVLEWRYAEVWAFLRHLGVEYCGLYDEGYTSLGGTNDTRPNPRLRVVEDGGVRYRPAYELEADEEERLGREW